MSLKQLLQIFGVEGARYKNQSLSYCNLTFGLCNLLLKRGSVDRVTTLWMLYLVLQSMAL